MLLKKDKLTCRSNHFYSICWQAVSRTKQFCFSQVICALYHLGWGSQRFTQRARCNFSWLLWKQGNQSLTHKTGIKATASALEPALILQLYCLWCRYLLELSRTLAVFTLTTSDLDSLRVSAPFAGQFNQCPGCQGRGLQVQTTLPAVTAHIRHLGSDDFNFLAEEQHFVCDF